jgi:hypothetical protein
VAALNKFSSRAPDVAASLREIFKLCSALDFDVVAQWRPREELAEEDALSRVPDASDWGLAPRGVSAHPWRIWAAKRGPVRLGSVACDLDIHLAAPHARMYGSGCPQLRLEGFCASGRTGVDIPSGSGDPEGNPFPKAVPGERNSAGSRGAHHKLVVGAERSLSGSQIRRPNQSGQVYGCVHPKPQGATRDVKPGTLQTQGLQDIMVRVEASSHRYVFTKVGIASIKDVTKHEEIALRKDSKTVAPQFHATCERLARATARRTAVATKRRF